MIYLRILGTYSQQYPRLHNPEIGLNPKQQIAFTKLMVKTYASHEVDKRITATDIDWVTQSLFVVEALNASLASFYGRAVSVDVYPLDPRFILATIRMDGKDIPAMKNGYIITEWYDILSRMRSYYG